MSVELLDRDDLAVSIPLDLDKAERTARELKRSVRIETRNPVTALPSFRRLANLDPSARAALRALLLDLKADAGERAQNSWAKHKAPMASYWKAVAVYAGHIARTLKAAQAAPPSNEVQWDAAGTVHELKCWPDPYDAIADGSKPFEWRKNDRDFKVGDTLHLRRFQPIGQFYTGEWMRVRVSYVLRNGFGLPDGYAVLGLAASHPAVIGGGE